MRNSMDTFFAEVYPPPLFYLGIPSPPLFYLGIHSPPSFIWVYSPPILKICIMLHKNV